LLLGEVVARMATYLIMVVVAVVLAAIHTKIDHFSQLIHILFLLVAVGVALLAQDPTDQILQ
jgi:hypothetical protein